NREALIELLVAAVSDACNAAEHSQGGTFADDVTVDHGLVEVAVECIVRPAAAGSEAIAEEIIKEEEKEEARKAETEIGSILNLPWRSQQQPLQPQLPQQQPQQPPLQQPGQQQQLEPEQEQLLQQLQQQRLRAASKLRLL
ncbi:hypothetical protein, conserved, partial [Eimeria acervulina]